MGLQHHTPRDWTLGDLIRLCIDPEALRALLESTPNTALQVGIFDASSLDDVYATLVADLGEFTEIAALWDRAKQEGRARSLSDWVQGSDGEILILGSHPEFEEVIGTVNAFLFTRLSKLVRALKESTRPGLSWFFVDELKQAGKLETLDNLLSFGRSKGVRLVLGAQDLQGLKEVWGPNAAQEIPGLCLMRGIFQTIETETAQWASSLFGELEIDEARPSFSPDKETGQLKTSWSQHVDLRKTVLPAEIMQLPTTNAANGLTGFYFAPSVGAWRTTTHPDTWPKQLTEDDEKRHPQFKRAPKQHEMLWPWNPEWEHRIKAPKRERVPEEELARQEEELQTEDLELYEPEPNDEPDGA